MRSLILIALIFSASAFAMTDKELINQGRHIVKIAGCNDCHTPMFGQNGGNVPEKDWLTGVPVGFKGPWGVTYPSNLRNLVSTFKEKPFIKHVRTKKYLPPMPGWTIAEMTDQELSAMYAFIRHLGPAGVNTPANLPPGQKVKGPFIYFVPVTE